jgi:hypothetical protein
MIILCSQRKKKRAKTQTIIHLVSRGRAGTKVQRLVLLGINKTLKQSSKLFMMKSVHLKSN